MIRRWALRSTGAVRAFAPGWLALSVTLGAGAVAAGCNSSNGAALALFASAGGVTEASASVAVRAGIFEWNGRPSLPFSQCSQLKIQVFDARNARSPVGIATTFDLGDLAAFGSLWSDSACTAPVERGSVVLPAEASELDLYVKPTRSGTFLVRPRAIAGELGIEGISRELYVDGPVRCVDGMCAVGRCVDGICI